MRVAVLIVAACVAAGAQDTERVFHFANLNTPASFQEVTNILRTVTELDKTVAGPSAETITTTGSAAQIAIADWLVPRLDASDGSGSDEYQVPGAADDVVRIIHAEAAQTPAALQELIIVIRTAAEIHRALPSNATRSIVVRAPSERAKLASWLVNELLSPPSSTPAEFLLANDFPRNPQKRIHIYVLQKANTPASLQETVNIFRTVADLTRVLPFNQTHAVVARGNDQQIAICDWLIPALDRMPPGVGESSAHIQILLPYPTEGEERVLYLPATSTPADLQQFANRIRTDTGITRVSPSVTAMAIALRGNATQVAKAEEIVHIH